MSFSKDGEYLLIGSSSGWIQVWDGGSLGVVNTIVLSKQIGKECIQSVTWFHYSGEAQSRRFLVLTPDGNVKLFSFYFERTKDGKEKWMGKCLELTLLYNIKGNIRDDF
jgi:WD40 repeat protein